MRIKYLLQLTHLIVAEWFLTFPYKKKASSKETIHDVFDNFVGKVNKIPLAKVLEVGSRNVSGFIRKDFFNNQQGYIGFDFHDGPNVDVVGDAHKLTSYFANDSFDALFSISVFEHLAMPWKAIIEMNRILKPGGLLFISTHPCWPAHELPWDFWRFQRESFTVLLNPKTGFIVEQCIEGLPGKIIPLISEPAVNGLIQCNNHLSISVLAKKISSIADPFCWDFSAEELTSSRYPKPRWAAE